VRQENRPWLPALLAFSRVAYIVFHVCAPRTRATSPSPRPIRGLSWLLKGPARRDVGATRELLQHIR